MIFVRDKGNGNTNATCKKRMQYLIWHEIRKRPDGCADTLILIPHGCILSTFVVCAYRRRRATVKRRKASIKLCSFRRCSSRGHFSPSTIATALPYRLTPLKASVCYTFTHSCVISVISCGADEEVFSSPSMYACNRLILLSFHTFFRASFYCV